MCSVWSAISKSSTYPNVLYNRCTGAFSVFFCVWSLLERYLGVANTAWLLVSQQALMPSSGEFILSSRNWLIDHSVMLFDIYKKIVKCFFRWLLSIFLVKIFEQILFEICCLWIFKKFLVQLGSGQLSSRNKIDWSPHFFSLWQSTYFTSGQLSQKNKRKEQ